jgi:hypothetical protein
VPVLEHALIASRTKLKRDNLLETVNDTYSPEIESSTTVINHFKEKQLFLSRMQALIKQCGTTAKRMGQIKKDISQTFRLLRFHLSRPTSAILPYPPLCVSEALRHLGDVYSKQSIADIWDLGDFFLEQVPLFQATLQVLQRYEIVVEEHQVLARQVSFLQSAVQRLEGQAKQDPTEDLVKRLSETYYQFQSIAHQLQSKGCYVNYAEMRLVSEIDHLHEVIYEQLYFAFI